MTNFLYEINWALLSSAQLISPKGGFSGGGKQKKFCQFFSKFNFLSNALGFKTLSPLDLEP